MAFDTGNGATLTFSGFTVDIVAISIGEQRIETLDITLLNDTAGPEQLVAADFFNAGSVVVEYLFDAADADQALGGAGASLVITWPLQSGESTAANITGDVIKVARKYPDLRNNELQTATLEFKWDGTTGPTLTAST